MERCISGLELCRNKLLVSVTLSLAADHRKIHVTGIFSDMRFSQMSGDVSGMEVWLVSGPRSYYAVVQMAEGEPEIPVVVPAEVNGLSVRFHLQESNLTFSEKGLDAALWASSGVNTSCFPAGNPTGSDQIFPAMPFPCQINPPAMPSPVQ
jgi:hypothetical protein